VKSSLPVPAHLWLLPLAVAIVPFVVTHVALLLAIQAGHVPACVPYLEGCTSISRAARHGAANTLFQCVMVPMAAVHLVNWWQARRWLQARHPDPRAGRTLLVLGVIAALALAVYAVALGTEGPLYRWMRRFGILLYFGCTYLAQLVFAHRLAQLGRARLPAGMGAISLALLIMGLASTVVSNGIADPVFKDRMENLLEWQLALLMTVWFVLQALVYRWQPAR
jgi:hypothetical protein